MSAETVDSIEVTSDGQQAHAEVSSAVLSEGKPMAPTPRDDAERKEALDALIDEYLDDAAINLSGGIKSSIGHGTIVGETNLDKKRHVEHTLVTAMEKDARRRKQPCFSGYDLIKQEGIHETIFVLPLTRAEQIDTGQRRTEKRLTPAGKSIFGKPKYAEEQVSVPVLEEVQKPIPQIELVAGGTAEAATSIFLRATGGMEYLDNSDRGGQQIIVELILPASRAMVLLQEIKNNPTIFREIIRKAFVERSEIGEAGWSGVTDNNRGHKIEPPYEKWENAEGKNVLRIYKLGTADGNQEQSVDLEY